jgi:hypothetical protein
MWFEDEVEICSIGMTMQPSSSASSGEKLTITSGQLYGEVTIYWRFDNFSFYRDRDIIL